jgi:integrase/recombinase XerC
MPCGPWQVTGADLVAWTGDQVWARETRRSVRASVRGFYGWGYASGLLEVDPSLALPIVSPSPPKPRPAPEVVYRQALALADPRARLILRLAAEVGLRRSEIALVHTRDLFEDLLGWSLVVHGKGSRDRVVPLPPALALELRRRGPGFVFPGEDGGHLSPRWVGKIATRLLPADWTLHTLRHRFATRAYGLERDLLVVQTLLGHSSPVTTRRYVMVDEDRLRTTVLAVAG